MATEISSHFNIKRLSTKPTSIVHEFTFASTDLSDRIKSYDSISRDATDVTGGRFKINLENASKTFNSLLTNKSQFFQEGIYNFGFATDSGTNDTIQLFGGTLSKAEFVETEVKLTFDDKLERLKNKKIGDSNTPISFTNTSVNPADLGWWMVTSYGGLSAIESTSNPDINYSRWLNWKQIFTDNTVLVQAEFTGGDVIEGLDKIQKITDSVIYAEGDNKIVFDKWTVTGSINFTITDNITTNIIPLEITGEAIINQAKVLYGFNVNSETWAGDVTNITTSSVNTFGVFEEVYQDETIWYADSISANIFGEIIVFRRSTPNATFTIESPLPLININVGDEVIFTSSFYEVNSQAYSVIGYEKDLEDKKITVDIDEGFNRGGGRLKGFILDDEVFGLLDQDYNPLVI
jgi:hypothetical protein